MTHADKGARLGNFIIDLSILVILILFATYLISFFYPEINDSHSLAFEVLASTIFFCYYFFLEYTIGRTLGKMLTKTIVVDKNGNKPKTFNVFARSLVRLVPMEGITFLFGHLGFHDLIPGTRVVKIEKKHKTTL